MTPLPDPLPLTLSGGRRRAWYERLPIGVVWLVMIVLGWAAVAGFVGLVYALLRVWWPS
jgi:hypothetical protein